jgi:hypothetical protein
VRQRLVAIQHQNDAPSHPVPAANCCFRNCAFYCSSQKIDHTDRQSCREGARRRILLYTLFGAGSFHKLPNRKCLQKVVDNTSW